MIRDVCVYVSVGVWKCKKEEEDGMGQSAWGPGETHVYDRDPFGLFHGAGMGKNVWE